MHDGGGIDRMAKHSGLLGVRGPVRASETRSTLGLESSQVPELRLGRAGELQSFRVRQIFSPARR